MITSIRGCHKKIGTENMITFSVPNDYDYRKNSFLPIPLYSEVFRYYRLHCEAVSANRH